MTRRPPSDPDLATALAWKQHEGRVATAAHPLCVCGKYVVWDRCDDCRAKRGQPCKTSTNWPNDPCDRRLHDWGDPEDCPQHRRKP